MQVQRYNNQMYSNITSHPQKIYPGKAECKYQKYFKNKYNAQDTSLSKYVWEMKEKNSITPNIKWYI